MERTRENYLTWLRDAHAMEEQALTMMRGLTSRLEHYPELRMRIEQHISETEGQERALQQLLDGYASDSSFMKDAMAKMAAAGQAISGMFTTDEVVKGGIASYTFEHMEIAAYEVLITTAEEIGDSHATSIFKEILAQEEAMAEWLRDNLPPTVAQFLRRNEVKLTAKR